MTDDALAEWLQPQLKTSGPAPQLSHIKAAILVARDSVGARAACRAVPGVPETAAHSRISKLAGRVGKLLCEKMLAAEMTLPQQSQPQPPPEPLPAQPRQPPSPHALPPPHALSPVDASAEDDLGLPPLRPVPIDCLPQPATSSAVSDSARTDSSADSDAAGSSKPCFPMPDVLLRETDTSAHCDARDISGEVTATRASEQRPERQESEHLASITRCGGCLTGPHVRDDAAVPWWPSPMPHTMPHTMPQPTPQPKRARPIDYSRFDHIGSDSDDSESSQRSPHSRPAPFEVPESARIDLDARSYVEREVLRDPTVRRDMPKKLRPKRSALPSAHMAIAKAKGHSSEKAARRYIKDFGYVHGIGAEPDDVDAFYADCIQNLPDGRQEVWRADRDFFPSSSESGSDDETGGLGNGFGDNGVDGQPSS